MKILAIDSTAKSASVAILDDDKLVGEFYLNVGFTHSQTLVPMIENLLSAANLSTDDISAFAVSNGPGSFTGVRIGIAAVKAMAMKNDTPCIGISTTECIAYNLINSDCIACAVMDARRDQVYNANFKIQNGKMTRLCKDRAISIDNLKKEISAYDNRIIFVGDGANLCYNMSKYAENVFVADECFLYQSAKSVAAIAKFMFLKGEFTSAKDLKPFYLRKIL